MTTGSTSALLRCLMMGGAAFALTFALAGCGETKRSAATAGRTAPPPAVASGGASAASKSVASRIAADRDGRPVVSPA